MPRELRGQRRASSPLIIACRFNNPIGRWSPGMTIRKATSSTIMPGVLFSEIRTGIYASIASANKYIRGSRNPMIESDFATFLYSVGQALDRAAIPARQRRQRRSLRGLPTGKKSAGVFTRLAPANCASRFGPRPAMFAASRDTK